MEDRSMERYPKELELRDGIKVQIRPMRQDDLDRSHRFFLSLPAEDRHSLKMDVTDRENVRIRMEQPDHEERWRLVALHDGEIVGDATLYQPRYGWKRHTGEIRCIIARRFQGKGLGRAMLKELFNEATRRNIEKLVGMVTEDQKAAVHILESLGFRHELTLRDHRRTLHGDLKDVLVMTVSLADLWRRMEDLIHRMDGSGQERYQPPPKG